jgi:hypothetical protein
MQAYFNHVVERMTIGVGFRHIFGSLVIVQRNGWQGLWAGNTINMLRILFQPKRSNSEHLNASRGAWQKHKRNGKRTDAQRYSLVI